MLSKNWFLDIMGDVKPDYVEEVLFMAQPAQDNSELEKYRKKSSFWKVFGSVAACVAVVGVGLSAVLLYRGGFFDVPAESTVIVSEKTDISESGAGEITSAEKTENTESTADTTRPAPDPYEVQEVLIALGSAINQSNTFEEAFAEFDEVDADKLIYKIEVYENSESQEQGIALKEEELKGEIPNNTIFVFYFSEDGFGNSISKLVESRKLPDGVVLHGLAGDEITSEDIDEVLNNNSQNILAWGAVKCNGFCYLSEPAGYCFNSIENPYLADPITGDINGGILYPREIKRYYVGDEICGLKVKSAEFSLHNMYGDNDHPEGCRFHNSVQFEGKVELTGYLYIENSLVSQFIPDNESSKKLPVLSTPFDQLYSFGSWGDDFKYAWENPIIDCGRISSYSALADCEANTVVKIKATLTNFSLEFIQGGPEDSYANGILTDIELL